MLERRTPLRAKAGLKSRIQLKSKSALKRTLFERTASPKAKPAEKKRHEPSLVERLDRVFSRYIRLRDSNGDGTFTCISCGRRLPVEYAQCGHYYPRANMSTRFDEDNCHAECEFDNCHNPKHLEGYRRNLIAKIGEGSVLELDRRAKEMKKWSHYELEELIEYYKERIKEIK